MDFKIINNHVANNNNFKEDAVRPNKISAAKKNFVLKINKICNLTFNKTLLMPSYKMLDLY